MIKFVTKLPLSVQRFIERLYTKLIRNAENGLVAASGPQQTNKNTQSPFFHKLSLITTIRITTIENLATMESTYIL